MSLGSATIGVIGNLGRDAETRYTKGGKMNCSWSMCVNHTINGREIQNWYRVTCWGKLGEVMDGLAQNGALKKGHRVYAQGRFVIDTYQHEQSGEERISYDITANEVVLLESAGEPVAAGPPRQQYAVPDDVDELPF